ncbi:hypothetical protein pb186bvf_015018 [Paramecium bursaria]
MKITKYAILLGVGLTTPNVHQQNYSNYYQNLISQQDELIDDETNISLKTIRDDYCQTLKVGQQGFIQITEQMKKCNYFQQARRYFGWQYEDY